MLRLRLLTSRHLRPTSSLITLILFVNRPCTPTINTQMRGSAVVPSQRPPCCMGIVGSSHVCAWFAWERCCGKRVSRSSVYFGVFVWRVVAVNTSFVMEGQGEAIGWESMSTFCGLSTLFDCISGFEIACASLIWRKSENTFDVDSWQNLFQTHSQSCFSGKGGLHRFEIPCIHVSSSCLLVMTH